MADPFDLSRSPFSTPEVEAAIAERRTRETAGRGIVQCVACGEVDTDHGHERPLCKRCGRRMAFGSIVDGFLGIVRWFG